MVVMRQLPPITHKKLHTLPLGPSKFFFNAYKKQNLDSKKKKRNLYYVNHSPWRHRINIFEVVNKNFNGSLINHYCVPEKYGCSFQEMSAEKHGCSLKKCQNQKMSAEKLLNDLSESIFVESPPGMGEDCYRHYEVLLAGGIPVVQKSRLSLGDLPILYIDKWSEVTPDFLLQQTNVSGTLQRMTKSYWIAKIKNV